MITKIKKDIKNWKKAIKNYSLRKKLKNKNFSIISNNCWGGFLYQDLGIQYHTPFIGLFIFAPDYIKMLKNLKEYLSADLKFICSEQSKYKKELDQSFATYPIGLLNDVEVHFLHYKNEEEAREKWKRRLSRLNWDNLFVKFCDRDLCTHDLIAKFDALDFRNKVCFTAHDSPYESIVWLKEFKNKKCVKYEWNYYKKYIDVVEWLNNGIIIRK